VPHSRSRRRGGEGLLEGGRERRKQVWVRKKGEESYADVVKGGPQKVWKGPMFSAQKQVLSWMESSVIGQFCA